MIIDVISDLHGFYPKLDGGDLLIVAGDLTCRDEPHEYIYFRDWLSSQNYKKKIVIAGNHDNCFELDYIFDSPSFLEIADYLCDSGTEFSYDIEGFPEEDEKFLPSGKRTLKIWGSPWTKSFEGMNPDCKAFTCDTEEELAEKWALIPQDTDILITHSPPHGILDQVCYIDYGKDQAEHVGSTSLSKKINTMNFKVHVFGHIHEAYGRSPENFHPIYINASHVNERYKPVNKPVRVIL